MSADLSVLRIALDGSVRTFVEGGLAKLPAELPARLRELGVLLRRVRDAWMYGGAVDEPIRGDADQLAVFQQRVAAERAMVGVTCGADLVLVSVVVVARGELATVSAANVGEELRRALEAVAYREPGDVLALEVVLTTVGGPVPGMFPINASLEGRVICTSCGGPFPQGLVSCPHCGAPAP